MVTSAPVLPNALFGIRIFSYSLLPKAFLAELRMLRVAKFSGKKKQRF